MGKKHSDRFTLQFDSSNPIHFNAVTILNEKERNKANYIAELIWEKEFGGQEKEKNEVLKEIVKSALEEVIRENKFMFTSSAEKPEEDNGEIILSKKNPSRDIPNGLNKELMQGLSAFGIKP